MKFRVPCRGCGRRYLLFTPRKIVFIVFLLCNQISLSQIKIGVKVGHSIGNINDTSDNIYAKDYSSTNGLDIGILAEFPVSNDFSIQTEISYAIL